MAEEGIVISINSVDKWKDIFQSAKDSKKLVVVDFTASWCGPCRLISPVLEVLAEKLLHVIFLKVDVDDIRTVAEEYQVRAMPTFILFKEGNVLDKIVGANKNALTESITKHAGDGATATATA